jgi:hypothetical protein
MGQFSVTIFGHTGSVLSDNQHVRLYKIVRLARPSSFIVHQSLAVFQTRPPIDRQIRKVFAALTDFSFSPLGLA